MIYLNINIRNPWSDRFKNVWNNAGSITKHKTWEIQILKTDNWFRFNLEYAIMKDHAGVGFEIGLLGWEFHCGIHDNRHWDYKKQQWEDYGKPS